MVYTLFIALLLLAGLYMNIALESSIVVLIIFLSVDISLGTIQLKKLKRECEEIKDNNILERNIDRYEAELVKLTIKKLTDENYLALKKIEQDQGEYNDYIQMWIHEVKLATANIKHLSRDIDSLEINSELENIDDSIIRIVALSSGENMEINTQFERVKLSVVCNSAIKSQMNTLLIKQVKIITDYDDCTAVIDKFWLTFILKQVINNSIKYGAREIKVVAKELQIEIYDDGLGIDSGELDLVFDKFYCGVRTKELVKSTGIGLYLVKKLANNMGYEVAASSLEQGTCIRICLDKEG